MKKVSAAVSLGIGLIVLFAGCGGSVTPNDRTDVTAATLYESGSAVSLRIRGSEEGKVETYTFDRDAGSLKIQTSYIFSSDPNDFPGVVEPNSAGYESLWLRIADMRGSGDTVSQTYAVLRDDGSIYGLVNLYSGRTKKIDGEFVLDVADAVSGTVFRYSPQTNEFLTLESRPHGVIVAFDMTHCVYLRGKQYYSKAYASDEEKKMFEDEAYGLGSLSSVKYIFADGYVCFCFNCFSRSHKQGEDYRKYIFATMAGETLAETVRS